MNWRTGRESGKKETNPKLQWKNLSAGRKEAQYPRTYFFFSFFKEKVLKIERSF